MACGRVWGCSVTWPVTVWGLMIPVGVDIVGRVINWARGAEKRNFIHENLLKQVNCHRRLTIKIQNEWLLLKIQSQNQKWFPQSGLKTGWFENSQQLALIGFRKQGLWFLTWKVISLLANQQDNSCRSCLN